MSELQRAFLDIKLNKHILFVRLCVCCDRNGACVPTTCTGVSGSIDDMVLRKKIRKCRIASLLSDTMTLTTASNAACDRNKDDGKIAVMNDDISRDAEADIAG
jgi:hypothetical protein